MTAFFNRMPTGKSVQHTILPHIGFHAGKDVGIGRLGLEVLVNVPHGDEGVHLDAIGFPDLHDGGFAGGLAHLAAVDGNEHVGDRHLAAAGRAA